MSKKGESIKGKIPKATFKNDLNGVSGAWSEECFTKVAQLFIDKWSLVESATSCIDHFKNEWMSQRLCRFYRGAAEGFVMNNNGLESYNKVLKDTGTFHERLPVNQLLPALQSWIGNESHRRDPVNVNVIPIALVPDYELKDKTDGYVLAISKLKFIQIDGHFIAVKNNKIQGENINREIANNILRQYQEYSWNSYDQFIAFQHNVSVITPDRRCNCYDFGRRFKCAHTECIKIVVDKEAIPEDAHNIKLHGRRKSGRPAKAKGKYVIQDYAMNVADPDEGDDYYMDDDANDYDDDAQCDGTSSSTNVMAGRCSGPSSSADAKAGHSSAPPPSTNTMAGRCSGPSSSADAKAGRTSGPSSSANAVTGRCSGPSPSADAKAGRTSGISASANTMTGRCSGTSSSANAMFGRSSGPSPSADAKGGQGSAPRQSPTTSATFSRPAAHSSLYPESVTREQPEKRCADVNQRGQSLKKQRSEVAALASNEAVSGRVRE